MTDFDPNDALDTQEQADAYISWCAENFMRLSQGEARTYRTAVRCAAWLLVVAVAPFHLSDDVERDRDALLEQLSNYSKLARAIERQEIKVPVEQLIVMRSSLDCWESVGTWAGHLLDAAKHALVTLTLIDFYPLIDLWDLAAPEAWTLLDAGSDYLAAINTAFDLDYADYAVQPSEMVIAKYTWQRVNNLHRHMGAQPPSPN